MSGRLLRCIIFQLKGIWNNKNPGLFALINSGIKREHFKPIIKKNSAQYQSWHFMARIYINTTGLNKYTSVYFEQYERDPKLWWQAISLKNKSFKHILLQKYHFMSNNSLIFYLIISFHIVVGSFSILYIIFFIIYIWYYIFKFSGGF